MKDTLYSNLKSMPIEEYSKYLDEADNKYITIREHPEDNNIIILNYTNLTVYEKRWNKQTMSARGLILDITNISNNDIKILSKPFDKFFNLGESKEYESNIDFSKIDFITDKMDGSLGISYFFKGKIRFATRGSFSSEQAYEANKIWNEKYEKYHDIYEYINNPVTYLVEIIYPENRIVIDYEGKRCLTLLGGYDLTNDEDLSYSFLEIIGYKLHMPVAEKLTISIELMNLLKKFMTYQKEGWVIRFSNGKRLKIKGDNYMGAHRAIYGLSNRQKVKSWLDDNMDKLIHSIPEECEKEVEELENLRDSLDAILNDKISKLSDMYAKALENSTNRKEFAIYISSNFKKEYLGILFEAYGKDEISKERVKEVIYKNYKLYT